MGSFLLRSFVWVLLFGLFVSCEDAQYFLSVLARVKNERDIVRFHFFSLSSLLFSSLLFSSLLFSPLAPFSPLLSSEFVSHYLEEGFDHVFLFDDQSTDGFRDDLTQYSDRVTIIRFSFSFFLFLSLSFSFFLFSFNLLSFFSPFLPSLTLSSLSHFSPLPLPLSPSPLLLLSSPLLFPLFP